MVIIIILIYHHYVIITLSSPRTEMTGLGFPNIHMCQYGYHCDPHCHHHHHHQGLTGLACPFISGVPTKISQHWHVIIIITIIMIISFLKLSSLSSCTWFSYLSWSLNSKKIIAPLVFMLFIIIPLKISSSSTTSPWWQLTTLLNRFPDSQRTMATSLLGMSYPLGIVVGQVGQLTFIRHQTGPCEVVFIECAWIFKLYRADKT